jgi:TonB family protein
MRQSQIIGKEPSLSKVVFVSLILHFLFISLVVFPLRTKEPLRTYNVTLVGPLRTQQVRKAPSAKSKSVKSLPAAKKRALKKPKAVTKKAVKLPPKAAMSLEEVKKEIERMRAISAITKKVKDKEAKKQEIQIAKQKAPDTSAKGVGIPGTGTDESMDYYDIISQKIWQHWFYAKSRSSGLEVIVSIKIDKSGEVISQEIEKFSGDVLFDRSAVKAISKASPFPAPPEELEVGVRFYL